MGELPVEAQSLPHHVRAADLLRLFGLHDAETSLVLVRTAVVCLLS